MIMINNNNNIEININNDLGRLLLMKIICSIIKRDQQQRKNINNKKCSYLPFLFILKESDTNVRTLLLKYFIKKKYGNFHIFENMMRSFIIINQQEYNINFKCYNNKKN